MEAEVVVGVVAVGGLGWGFHVGHFLGWGFSGEI